MSERPCICNRCGIGEPYKTGDCRACWLFYNDPKYRAAWSGTSLEHAMIKQTRVDCKFLGEVNGKTERCPTCAGVVLVKLRACEVHGECSPVKEIRGLACCKTCPNYRGRGEPVLAPATSSSALRWVYGVTTVPAREKDLLPRTLASLVSAGFDKPRIFVDGEKEPLAFARRLAERSPFFVGLEVTARYPAIRAYGNWILALAELYIREPNASRYALFQDDFVASRNLRGYLEKSPYPEKGYLNLYTFPSNQTLAKGEGFYESNQHGRGAVALVFDKAAVLALLTHQSPHPSKNPEANSVGHMVYRPMDSHRGHKAIDGGVVEAMKKAGFKEHVHNPSLVQHTGERSTVGNKPHKQSTSFRGENFDALTLLDKVQV